MFSRIPRFSRFNARAWKYQELFATPRARRLTAAGTLTVIALVGTAIFWSPKPAMTAAKRSAVWKSFVPPRNAVAKATNSDANSKSGARETSSLLSPVVIRTVKPAVKPVSKSTASGKTASGKPAADPLGPAFVDADRGFSMRFPSRWSIRTSSNKPWTLDCSDGRGGLISLGFSPCPPGLSAQTLTAGWVSRQVENRDGGTAQAQGSATISGRKALWSKSTMSAPGKAASRTTRISYILPLADGRLAEIRIAAAAESFESVSSVMKQAVATFRPVVAPSNRQAIATAE